MIDDTTGDAIRPNQRRILALLGQRPSATRGELAQALQLPKATIAGLVDDLVARGLISELEPAGTTGHAGRPARALALAGPPPAIGVLVWSTGLLRVAVASLRGEILAERTIPMDKMDPQADLDDLLGPALALLDEAADQIGRPVASLRGAVLGVPAPFQRGVGSPVRLSVRSDGERPSGYVPSWLRTDPAAELSRRTGIPAVVENDANLGTLGEHTFGAGRGDDCLVYLKLGQYSLGAGLIVNERLHRGAAGFAGELAHIQVNDDGPLCACGGRGCLIQLIGPGLVELAQPAYEQPLTYTRMLDLAAQGDPGLRRILGDLGRTIGRPLADLCTMINPAAIVVDGSIGPGGQFIIDGITESVARHAAPTAAESVRIVSGSLGTHADLLGAVSLVRAEG